MAKPALWIVAGPKGDGKTTYAFRTIRAVSGSVHFVNLDEIARRVSEGGHDVAEADVRRRFERALANFTEYCGVVDLWRVFDNNGAKPIVAAEGKHGCRAVLNDVSTLPPPLGAALKTLPPCAEAD